MTKDYKSREKVIASYLKERYKVKAIILVGSRAVGDFAKDSDWDMFAFTTKLKKSEVGQRFSRTMIEEYGFPSVPGETDIQPYFLPLGIPFSFSVFNKKLRYAKVILDSNGYATKLLRSAKKFYGKRPPTLRKHEALIFRQRSEGYLKKFSRLLKKRQYGHLFEYMGWYFNEMIICYWFSFRGEWELRPQQAFAYIKQKDPRFYKHLRVVFSEKTYKDKIKACETLHQILFESKNFKKIINSE